MGTYQDTDQNDTMPLVSVIITTKNEEKHIATLLASIVQQNYPKIETILVDNNSTDSTVELAAAFPVKIFNKGPERSAQRNCGAESSTGEFLLFLDADMKLEHSVITDCVNLLTKYSEIHAAIIPEVSYGDGYWAKCKALERNCYIGDESIEGARFYRKPTFFEVGGFDTNFTGVEDWDMSRKIKDKYAIGRISSFINHNEGQLQLLKLVAKKRYYARPASGYFKKHRQSMVSSQAIYLLRPAFYKNWKQLIAHPFLLVGMIIMLTAEFLGGLTGYMETKYRERA